MTAVDVVKDSFNPQLEPLEENLGHFSCHFSSASSSSSSSSPPPSSCTETQHRHQRQHTTTSPTEPNFDHARTHAAAVPNPLDPYPLPPRPSHLTASSNAATTTAISNATLTALLAAEDLVNASGGNKYSFTNYNSPRTAAVNSSSSSGGSSGMRDGIGGGIGNGRGHSRLPHRVLAGAEDPSDDIAEDPTVSVAVATAVPKPGTALDDFASFAHHAFFHARPSRPKPGREQKDKPKEKEVDLSHLHRIQNRYLAVNGGGDADLNGYVNGGEVVEKRSQSEATIWPRGRLAGNAGTLAGRAPAPDRGPGADVGAAGPYPGSGPYPYPNRALDGVGSGLFPSRAFELTGQGSGAGAGSAREGTGTGTETAAGAGTGIPGQQRRAASLTSGEMRRVKGRGMIFW
jgi:hypothetical protein